MIFNIKTSKRNALPRTPEFRVDRNWIFTHIFLGACVTFIALLLALSFPQKAKPYTIEKNDDQETGQIVISPTKVELSMDPGERETREIVIVNRTGQPMTFEFLTEDFEGSLDPSQATIFLGVEDSPRGAKNWLEPEVMSIVLGHGETLTMTVDVKVPLDAEPGGHYAALFASSITEETIEDGSNVQITSRVGTLFLVTVSGDIEEDGTLNEPEIPVFSEHGPIKMGLVFNNLGNVHLKPSGKVVIRNFFGQTVSEIPVDEWIVLPESSRRTLVEWDGDRLLGRYTATAEITYGDGDVLALAETSFWVIPWKIVLAVLVVLAVLSFAGHWFYKRYTKRRKTQAELEEELSALRAVRTEETSSSPQAAPPPAMAPKVPEGHIALNELFPSMEDTRMVDIEDMETQELVRDLIYSELDMARSYLRQGMIEEARRGLLEARSAAERIGLLSEVGVIDDVLHSL